MFPLSPGIEEDRSLTPEEYAVIKWLLEHAERDNSVFLNQLDSARVAARCGCGCASIDVSVAGVRAPATSALARVADFQWRTEEGHLHGACVFERDGLLAGLDLWSIDGQSTPAAMPPTDRLVPLLTS